MMFRLPRRLQGLQLLNHILALQVPNHDTARRGRTKPVSGRGEAQGVDLVLGIEGVEVFRVI